MSLEWPCLWMPWHLDAIQHHVDDPTDLTELGLSGYNLQFKPSSLLSSVGDFSGMPPCMLLPDWHLQLVSLPLTNLLPEQAQTVATFKVIQSPRNIF